MKHDKAFLDQVRARIRLAELVGVEVALKRAGRDLRGLCPFHQERKPSFYVVEDKGYYHCFGCGAHGDAFQWIVATTGCPFPEAVQHLASLAGLSGDAPTLKVRPIVKRPQGEALEAERRRKIEWSLTLWAKCERGQGTLVERYLRARRIRLPVPPVLRFLSWCKHPDGRSMPAMVAGVTGADGAMTGVHRTFLRPDGGGKAAVERAKLMAGACWGGAVRLTPWQPLMILAEGIETSLSVLQALIDPDEGIAMVDGEPCGVWAALSLGNLGAAVLPEGTRELILAGDADAKDQERAEEALVDAANRQRERRIEVRIARAPEGRDFNDMLPEGAGTRAEAWA